MSDVDYTTERWLPVAMPGYKDFYDVSDHGRVRCTKPGRLKILRLSKNARGYWMSHLSWPKSTQKMISVHRLVALTFIGSPPTEKHEVAHNDGVPGNNHISNLRWATRKENEADKIAHGTAMRGEKNHLAKLSKPDVENIFRLRESGLFLREIAARYRVTETRICDIFRGKTWAHVVPTSTPSF